jgi:hypothetical protein
MTNTTTTERETVGDEFKVPEEGMEPVPADKQVARLKKQQKRSPVLLPKDPVAPPPLTEQLAGNPTAEANAKSWPTPKASRMFVVRMVAPGSVVWNDREAGFKFNGQKNRARFAAGVASGATTVGELLKLPNGPTSGDLRHWLEHSYSADGQPWIEVSGMKFLAPRK